MITKLFTISHHYTNEGSIPFTRSKKHGVLMSFSTFGATLVPQS